MDKDCHQCQQGMEEVKDGVQFVSVHQVHDGWYHELEVYNQCGKTVPRVPRNPHRISNLLPGLI